tara:strand:+ start:139 stop:726 length:588 start_codon:yes stop_codon:yes gene_type:complete
MGTIKTTNIEPIADNGTVTLGSSGDTFTMPSGGKLIAPGHVIQVISTTKTDTFSNTGQTFANITGLSVSITPSSTSSKIFITANLNLSGNNRYTAMKFVRGSTLIAIGDADGSRARVTSSTASNHNNSSDIYIMNNSSSSFLDTPNTTSATTYTIQIGNTADNSKINYINRPSNDTDANYIMRGISTLTVMEIAG